MSDTIFTIDQLNRLFQNLTIVAMGITVDPYNKVRVAYATKGQPTGRITDDVIYVRCLPQDGAYNRQRETIYSDIELSQENLVTEEGSRLLTEAGEGLIVESVSEVMDETTYYTRILAVIWAFYGPNSYDGAIQVRDALFRQTSRNTLKVNNVFMSPDMQEPRRVPELFEGQWWERVDLTAYFNELVVRRTTAPYVDAADISIYDSTGKVAEVSVTNPATQ
jgi:hypothetical protein